MNDLEAYPDHPNLKGGFAPYLHEDETTLLDVRSVSAAEGEGFLVFPVYRWAEDRSDVVILDALNVERALLATVRLPHRLPLGFHGNFAQGVTRS